MGTEYSVLCKGCGYHQKFIIGIGMLYYPENLLDFDSEFALLPLLIRSKKVLNRVRELTYEENIKVVDGYGHKIYRCPKCGKFYNRFHLKLEYADGDYEIKYKCTKCKKELELISNDFEDENIIERKEIDLSKYPCPECGKYELVEDEFYPAELWD